MYYWKFNQLIDDRNDMWRWLCGDSRKSVAIVWLAKQHIFDNPTDRRICDKDEVSNGTVPVAYL